MLIRLKTTYVFLWRIGSLQLKYLYTRVNITQMTEHLDLFWEDSLSSFFSFGFNILFEKLLS